MQTSEHSLPIRSGAEKVRVGTCAWSYDDWRGVFYPEHLGANHRLEFYARHFDSVEIDSTFYAAPSLHAAAHWLDVTPEHFLFSVKMPREITHERKLRRCEDLLEHFLGSLAPMRTKLGAVLIQLPPFFTPRHDELALREFVQALPRDFRFAIEFRDHGWHMPRTAHLLAENRVCWVWHDVTPLSHSLEGAFEFLPRTTDFLYVRLLGDLETKYGGDGSRLHKYKGLLWPRDASLDTWALRIGAHLRETHYAFVYTNNHFEGFSPHTCVRFAERFGLALHLPSAAELEGRDEADPQMNLL